MVTGCGWEEAVETNKESFFNHSVNVVNSDGPIYVILNQKKGANRNPPGGVKNFQVSIFWKWA